MEVTTFSILFTYLILIFISITLIIRVYTTRQKNKDKSVIKFIEKYKNHTIYQNVRDDYFMAFNINEDCLKNRSTLELIKSDIDGKEINTQIL